MLETCSDISVAGGDPVPGQHHHGTAPVQCVNVHPTDEQVDYELEQKGYAPEGVLFHRHVNHRPSNARGRGQMRGRGRGMRRGSGRSRVYVPRRRQADVAVIRSVQDSVDRLQGERDGIMEAIVQDIEEKLEADYTVRPVSPIGGVPLAPRAPPVLRNDDVDDINDTETVDCDYYHYASKETVAVSNEVSTYIDFVKAHFAAYGYTEKTHLSARANLLRWKAVSKAQLNTEQCVSIIDHVFEMRQFRVTAWTTLKMWFRDWWYDLTYNKMVYGLGAAITGIGLALALSKRRGSMKQILGLTSVIGVVTGLRHYKTVRSTMRVKTVKRLTDYCTQHPLTNEQVVDENAEVKMPDELRVKCVSKSVPVGFSFGIDYAWVPRACTHNEMNALVTRQMQPRIPVTPEGLHALTVSRMIVGKFFNTVTLNESRADWLPKFLEKYPKNRRQQVLRSMDDMIVDCRVDGFPKIEVMVGKPVSKRKVRFISGFSDGYLAETGPEYYLWQKAIIKAHWNVHEKALVKKFVYTGGMHADTIGEWFQIRKDMGRTILLLDMSKFDSRNKEAILGELYRFYESHLSDRLYHYLYETFNKFGKTKSGIKFHVEGTVASGRIDTSFGNTLIVFMCAVAILYMLDPHYLDDFDVSALGDDNNISVPEFHHTIDDIKRVSALIGHEADGLIITPDNYHNLEYCSQRVWQVQPNKSVLGPKVGRLLAKTFICHKYVPDNVLVEHIAGVLIGFKHFRWVPVFRAVYIRFFQCHPNVQPKRYYGDQNPHKITLSQDIDVCEETVLEQFEAVYGFRAEALEEEIMHLNFSMGDCYYHPLIDILNEVDGVSYTSGLEDVYESMRQGFSYLGEKLHGACFH